MTAKLEKTQRDLLNDIWASVRGVPGQLEGILGQVRELMQEREALRQALENRDRFIRLLKWRAESLERQGEKHMKIIGELTCAVVRGRSQ